MKKLITLLIAILSVAGISADNYNEYLEASRKYLAYGNKEKAESCYRIYTKMTGKKDATLEKAFYGSAQSGNVGSMTINYPNGDHYEGETKDGKRHGKGTMIYSNGDRYEGEWKDDKKNGQGVETWRDGYKYEGEFKDDKCNGQGTETWPSGDKYVGQFKDYRYYGKGTMFYADNRLYVGEWKDGKKHGYGVLTH